ncbi:hypothetical protein H0X06_05315 [Candidatus Dependentiae bacterium]|nr:hypothetical protein [Candidatus Dependentiae bacterium]
MIKKLHHGFLASSLIVFFSYGSEIPSENAQPVEYKEKVQVIEDGEKNPLIELMGKNQPIENLIENVRLKKHSILIFINESFKNKWLYSNFFVSYERDINLKKIPYTIAILPFILSVYPVIWISGQNYSIDSMDEDVFYSLEKIKKVLQRLYPKTPLTGNLIPKKLVKNRPTVPLMDKDKHVAILFSSGLDSVACSFEHMDKKQLLITTRGQDDLPLRAGNVWKLRKENIIKYAQNYGHKNAFITANHSEFLNWSVLNHVSPEIATWKFDTTEGVGLFGLAAPILYTKGYPLLLIGSTYTWNYQFPSAANPLVDNNLKVASSICLNHEHFNATRFDKIKLIVDAVKEKALTIPRLRVCDYHILEENCCMHCAKCQTAMNALVVLGEDPVPYGFNVTPEEVKERTKKYFANGQGRWTCWCFCDMQKKLRLMKNIPQSVKWMLKFNFMRKVSDGMTGAKKRVNWQDFKDLAPESLEIPVLAPGSYCDAKKRR